jgi:hypothetical protein
MNFAPNVSGIAYHLMSHATLITMKLIIRFAPDAESAPKYVLLSPSFNITGRGVWRNHFLISKMKK